MGSIMDIKSFFAELFRNCPGWIYLWTLQHKRSYPIPVNPDMPDAVTQLSQRLTDDGFDVYFSLGCTPAPVPENKRSTAAGVSALGCVWVDIDIADDNAHASQKLPPNVEYAELILPHDLPPSIIVSSGHGLHAYWLLKQPAMLTTETRETVTLAVRKLQQLCKDRAAARGWTVDSTADPSRILRVPGTWNFKNPMEPVKCEIIESSDVRYDLSVFTALDVAVPEPAAEIREPKFKRNPTDGNAAAMIANCKFLQHCQLDATKITYEEWVAALSNLARASDGVQACHELSKIDTSRYKTADTDRKIAEVLDNMSPTTCDYIQHTLGFRYCDQCPVKCPSGWSLGKLPQAIATVRAVANPTPDTVFTPEVIGALATVQQQAPIEFARFKAKLQGAVNLGDLNKSIAKERQNRLKIASKTSGGTSVSSDGRKALKSTAQLVSDCPIDLIIPAGFSFDQTGVVEYKQRMDGELLKYPASGTPVVITGRVYNMDTSEEKLELSFRYYNSWRTVLQQRSTVYSARSIVKLSDYGLNVSSETAKHLVKFLQQLESVNPDAIPLKYSVGNLGWRHYGDEFVLPAISKYAIEMDDEGAITEAMQVSGTMAGWMKTAGEVRQYVFSRLILAASIATPLLYLFHQRNFMLYFWGTSGGGKTAAMKAALSVWGNPDQLMTSFLTTKAGLERRLSLLSDFPAAINERQVAGQGREKQEYLEYIVYMLEGGKGKGRASKTGLQKTSSWRTIGMANGEEPLTRETSVRGVRNRIMEINTFPVMPDELAKRVHQMQDYGWAGAEFIRRLLSGKDQAHDIWTSLHDKLSQSYAEYASSHVDAMAVIMTADVLSSMWLWNIAESEAMRQALYLVSEVFKSLLTARDMSDPDRAWEFIQSWIVSNPNHFEREFSSRDIHMQSPLYGFIRGNTTYVFPAHLRKAMEDEGISYEKSLRELAQAGQIPGSDGTDGWKRTAKVVWYQGKSVRVIAIPDDVTSCNV